MSITAMKMALKALEKIATVAAMDYEYQRWAKEPLAGLRQAIEKAQFTRSQKMRDVGITRRQTSVPLKQHPTDPDKLVFRSHLRKGSEMSSPIDLAMQALEVLRTEPMARTAADKAQALLEQIEQAQQYVMVNAQGNLERISLVQTGVGISIQPVAWMYDFLNPDSTDEVIKNWVTQDLSEIYGAKGFNVRPLYTVPPQRKPLDDMTILDLADKHLHDQETYQALAFARAIEREIKENK